jgi:hypothetical protein
MSKTSSHTVETYTSCDSCETLISTREAITMRHRSSATSTKRKNKHVLSRHNSHSDQLEASCNTVIADLESSLSQIEIEGINDFLFDENLFEGNTRGRLLEDCDDFDDGDDVSDLSSVSSYSVADSLCAGYLRKRGVYRLEQTAATASKADYLLENDFSFEDDYL